MATPTPQQLTTAVTMDMSCMVHTQGSASMMVLGTEMLQSAVKQREVSYYTDLNTPKQSSFVKFPTDNCPKVSDLRYGKVWVTGYSYSSTAYYTCDYGYELQGSHSRKCQHDGTWYGKAPVCLKARTSKDHHSSLVLYQR